jgi:hypothetical protein
MKRAVSISALLLGALLALYGVVSLALETSHAHDEYGNHPEEVSATGEGVQANTPDTNRRCGWPYPNTSSYWHWSWQHVVTSWARGISTDGQYERYIYREQHRWLGAWPRHDHYITCAWRPRPIYV